MTKNIESIANQLNEVRNQNFIFGDYETVKL